MAPSSIYCVLEMETGEEEGIPPDCGCSTAEGLQSPPTQHLDPADGVMAEKILKIFCAFASLVKHFALSQPVRFGLDETKLFKQPVDVTCRLRRSSPEAERHTWEGPQIGSFKLCG